ncbi:hypothetical protein NP493_47g03031 [Ridgeia piscesae]|uniref:Uncharacterized protein n=1 Tax=Ridgeia piscesae TaxID=27915 RepID=A0AAD9PBR8_RIDPI|nr:hypothetical protein NP493_47g03031 [Ridgeia piscesae]
MRWEDCVKRDLERVGGEWRTTAKDKDDSNHGNLTPHDRDN